MARYINTASLDFDTIKVDIIDYFKTNDTFKDYDFTGSGLNVLIDILAYNTHYNALTANLSINEMFLDSAVKRDSVVSIAKSLGYTPRSARSSRAYVDLRIDSITNPSLAQFSNAPDTLTVPSLTPFFSRAANASYTFYTLSDETAGKTKTDINGTTHTSYTYPQMEIAEGTLITQTFTAQGLDIESFDLSNTNIDTTTIRVTVDGIAWKNSKDFGSVTGISGTTEVYFVEEARNQKHRIYFGNDTLGKKLAASQDVEVSYLITKAEEANNITEFSVGQLIRSTNGAFQLTITNPEDVKSSSGEGIEVKDEIRENATSLFAAQNRATTVSDYEAIIKNNFTNISSISVWGGEDQIPADFGSVYISIQPKVPAGGLLSNLTKSQIVSDLRKNYSVVSINPIIIDPIQTDLIVKTLVLYDESRLSTLTNELSTKIINLFESWNESYIGDFLKPFRSSSANTEIVNADDAIVSVNTRLNLSREITADENGLFTEYQLDFGNRLYHPHNGFNAANGGILSSSIFTLPGEVNTAGFDEDGYGNIRIFNNVNTQRVYKPGVFGYVDYTTGIININELSFAPNSSVRFTVAPESYDVIAFRNNILKINTGLSIVNVVSQTDTEIIRSLDSSRGI